MALRRIQGFIIGSFFGVIEFFIPIFLSYFLRKEFRKWKKRDLISNYKVKATRSGKYRYKVDLDFYLTENQAKNRLSDILDNFSKKGDGGEI